MTRTNGLLVVNRIAMMRDASQILATRPAALALSGHDVFRRYRGLDGEPWPHADQCSCHLDDGLADVADWPAVQGYLRGLTDRDECDVILLDRAATSFDQAHPGWSPAGFDVGYFESEWSHFSMILNEILLGTIAELRAFAARLNEHLLLPTRDDAMAVLAERDRLRAMGQDVEQAPPPVEPIAIRVRQGR